jgi:hypothetical protein
MFLQAARSSSCSSWLVLLQLTPAAAAVLRCCHRLCLSYLAVVEMWLAWSTQQQQQQIVTVITLCQQQVMMSAARQVTYCKRTSSRSRKPWSGCDLQDSWQDQMASLLHLKPHHQQQQQQQQTWIQRWVQQQQQQQQGVVAVCWMLGQCLHQRQCQHVTRAQHQGLRQWPLAPAAAAALRPTLLLLLLTLQQQHVAAVVRWRQC